MVRTGDKVRIQGWTIDPDKPADPTLVDIGIDGAYFRTTTADLARADVAQAHPEAGPNHGFDFTFDAADGGTHQVCVLAWNVGLGNPTTGTSPAC